MKIPKWTKITIIIGGVLVILIMIAVGLDLHTGCIRRNPKKVIAHWERVFENDFPDDIQNVKAATTWLGWDNGHTGYIIKFRIEPNSLNSFVKFRNLKQYIREDDERHREIIPLPKWFTRPIKKGKMGKVSLSAPKHHASYSFDIYIDTSDEKIFVVYMVGEMP